MCTALVLSSSFRCYVTRTAAGACEISFTSACEIMWLLHFVVGQHQFLFRALSAPLWPLFWPRSRKLPSILTCHAVKLPAPPRWISPCITYFGSSSPDRHSRLLDAPSAAGRAVNFSPHPQRWLGFLGKKGRVCSCPARKHYMPAPPHPKSSLPLGAPRASLPSPRHRCRQPPIPASRLIGKRRRCRIRAAAAAVAVSVVGDGAAWRSAGAGLSPALSLFWLPTSVARRRLGQIRAWDCPARRLWYTDAHLAVIFFVCHVHGRRLIWFVCTGTAI
jgi:hypothetical protein